MTKINHEEYEVLKEHYDMGGEWIARDANGLLYYHSRKPNKLEHSSDNVWDSNSFPMGTIGDVKKLFHFVKWTDSEPYNIAELIEEYESSLIESTPWTPNPLDFESEDIEMKKDIEWLKSWFDDDKSYTGEYVKFKINHCRGGHEVEEEHKYYAKLKEVQPLEGEWLTNLSGSNYYALDTKGLMLGEFILGLVGIKTEASTHTLKDWERYGINDSNAEFVEVEDLKNLVEEEQKYRVIFPSVDKYGKGFNYLAKDCYHKELWVEDSRTDGLAWEERSSFTEDEIRDLDKGDILFEHFAVPVEEMGE